MINELENLAEENIFFRELIKENSNVIFHEHIFQEYIDNEEISSFQLSNIFKFYENYGICSKIRVDAIYKDEISPKVFFFYIKD